MANSTQTATSDGNLELLNLSIDYLDRSEISVFFNSLPTTAWSWIGSTDKTIKFTPKVPAGVQVLVRRTTDSSQLRHTYSRGAAFIAPTLDESLSQVLHIAQEAQESNLSADFFSDVNMHGNRVVNSFPGVEENDVATVGQVVALSAPSVASAAASAASAGNSASAAGASALAASNSATAAQSSAAAAAASVGGTIRADGTVAMAAELTLAGNAAGNLGAVPKQQLESAFFPGWIAPMARMTAPPGWLRIDGKTIGNAASGATSRANADTAALFAELWAFPAASAPIFDSTGAASTRGASAAADFAAGKRLSLFTPDGGAFLRMWAPGQTRDAGRAAGSVQEQQLQAHQHIENSSGGGQGHGGDLPVVNTVGSTWTSGPGLLAGPGDVGSENRPYNLAIPHYIKL